MTRSELSTETVQWLFENAPSHVTANVRLRDEWCGHLEGEQLDMLRQVEMPNLKKALEEFPEMTNPKTITIFNSIYKTPEMERSFSYPDIWVWEDDGWVQRMDGEREYVYPDTPDGTLWSYEHPCNAFIPNPNLDLDFAYMEIENGKWTTHPLTPENRRSKPTSMAKPLTIFNSLYHVPQMGPGLSGYPVIWVWVSKGKCWTKRFCNEKGYVHDPEPSRMWSYENPGLRYHCTGEENDKHAFIEVLSPGRIMYHTLTPEKRLKMPGYMREKVCFEHKVTKVLYLKQEAAMMDATRNDGWELVSVVKCETHFRYYWKRPEK